MTVSYSLAPNPFWYFSDLFGRPLGAGKMYTYKSLNKSVGKPVYQDQAGTLAWTNPVLFDESGSQGPFYWEFDDASPDDLYYIEIYDEDNRLIRTIDNFTPPSGAGGSIVTSSLDLENLVKNNVFWRNIGTSITPLPIDLVISPSNHEGFSSGYRDVRFTKNNTSAIDQITFTEFLRGSTPLTGDVTPLYYINYACTNTPAGETTKVFQFPLSAKVKNFENTDFTISVWAQGVSGTQTLQAIVYQVFGDGGAPTAPVSTLVATFSLTSGWVKYTATGTIPTVGGTTLGSCENDGLFLRIQLPLDAACEINFTKPSLYLSTVIPSEDFITYDDVNAVISSPRTADIRVSMNTFQPGWVEMDDGTIGSASSGATSRANSDTFPLYEDMWNNISDTFAPVSTGRGASAIADFAANKTIALPKTLGRALACLGEPSSGGTGTTWSLGEAHGEEEHTLTVAELPAHSHGISGGASGVTATFPDLLHAGLTGAGQVGIGETITNTGSDEPHNSIQPTVNYRVFAKL